MQNKIPSASVRLAMKHAVISLAASSGTATLALAQDSSTGGVTTASGTVSAGEDAARPSAQELAKLKQNPVSGLRQLLVTASVNPNVPDADGRQGIYSLQAVWPFRLNDDWRVVTYTIVPVADLPATPDHPALTGVGNTLLNFYVSPSHASGKWVWGFGPAVSLPTHTKTGLGSDQYGLGPSGLLYYAEDAWSAGVVLQNVWSTGSGNDRFNEFGAQYIFNYNLSDGWYLFSNQTITANWNTAPSQRWTVPVAAGVGRIFDIGPQPVSASLQLFSNAVRPDSAARWGVNFQFALLFP